MFILLHFQLYLIIHGLHGKIKIREYLLKVRKLFLFTYSFGSTILNKLCEDQKRSEKQQ